MNDLPTLRKEAVDFANSAVELENKEDYEGSRKMFIKCINTLKRILEVDTNKYNVSTYNSKISEYEEMKILLKGDRNSDQGIKQLGVKLVDLTLTLCTLVRDKGHEVLASELRSLTFKSVPDSRLLIEK